MTQAETATSFSALHVRGKPLVLYNIWDAGSAKAVAVSGAKAVATGSWSMAAAQGYPDGEAIPLDTVELIVRQIGGPVAAEPKLHFSWPTARGRLRHKAVLHGCRHQARLT